MIIFVTSSLYQTTALLHIFEFYNWIDYFHSFNDIAPIDRSAGFISPSENDFKNEGD